MFYTVKVRRNNAEWCECRSRRGRQKVRHEPEGSEQYYLREKRSTRATTPHRAVERFVGAVTRW